MKEPEEFGPLVFHGSPLGSGVQCLSLRLQVKRFQVFAIIDRKPVMDRCPEDVKEPLDFLPSVSFSNVRFSYPSKPEVEVLRGVTFTIPAGQLVAIVGPSGSGKTTCLRLMNGFYDPPQGTVEFCRHQGQLVLKVRVSGVDIRHVTGAWLRARIAFVQQQTTLLGATVADAIRCGVAGSDADVTDVAKIAGVHDVIDQMPKRYATPLSGNISDDVRKRLAIARALLTNPDILLLDSCFSSMAPEVEGALLSAITEVRLLSLTRIQLFAINQQIRSVYGPESRLRRNHRVYVRMRGIVET
ncbi:multidrug resistance protein pgp-1-like [Schistocerca cancellata]|uniref:multidrug resistance protein pgp-1-like n=1 Tax=Schistocerca cancellata TaxID=274614 RepID=UPI002119781E|nr:multidrug resistance protein pgp-1-like [Schistocerca cancellata]